MKNQLFQHIFDFRFSIFDIFGFIVSSFRVNFVCFEFPAFIFSKYFIHTSTSLFYLDVRLCSIKSQGLSDSYYCSDILHTVAVILSPNWRNAAGGAALAADAARLPRLSPLPRLALALAPALPTGAWAAFRATHSASAAASSARAAALASGAVRARMSATRSAPSTFQRPSEAATTKRSSTRIGAAARAGAR